MHDPNDLDMADKLQHMANEALLQSFQYMYARDEKPDDYARASRKIAESAMHLKHSISERKRKREQPRRINRPTY